MMGDVIVPTLTNFVLSPDYLCAKIIESCDDVDFIELDAKEYVTRILKDKPDIIKNDDFIDSLYGKMKESNVPRKTFKAAHFSDVHVDLFYKAGTNAKCNLPLCCRAENGLPEK